MQVVQRGDIIVRDFYMLGLLVILGDVFGHQMKLGQEEQELILKTSMQALGFNL